VRYSSFSSALVASGLSKLGSLRNAGMGLGAGASKVSSGTKDVAGAVGAAASGVGGAGAAVPTGGAEDVVLRPVRLSHLVSVSDATMFGGGVYMDMAAGPIDPDRTDADYKGRIIKRSSRKTDEGKRITEVGCRLVSVVPHGSIIPHLSIKSFRIT
jgi:hypothetical protein